MVLGVLPVAKLGALLIAQISKPFANSVKKRAKDNHVFKQYICMPPAQCYNWCEVKASRLGEGLGKSVKIPKLNDEKAIELGANLLGEIIIFGIAGTVLYHEYARQVRKDVAKEEARVDKIAALRLTILELHFQAERKDAQLRELTRKIYALHSQVVRKPGGTHSPDASKDSPPAQSASPSFTLPTGASPHGNETHHETPPTTPTFDSLPPSKDIGGVLVESEPPTPAASPTDETPPQTPPTFDSLPPSKDIGGVLVGSEPPAPAASPTDETPQTPPTFDSLPPSEDIGGVLVGSEPPIPAASPTDETPQTPPTFDSLPPSKDIGGVLVGSEPPTPAASPTDDTLPPRKDIGGVLVGSEPPIPAASPTDDTPQTPPTVDSLPPRKDICAEA